MNFNNNNHLNLSGISGGRGRIGCCDGCKMIIHMMAKKSNILYRINKINNSIISTTKEEEEEYNEISSSDKKCYVLVRKYLTVKKKMNNEVEEKAESSANGGIYDNYSYVTLDMSKCYWLGYVDCSMISKHNDDENECFLVDVEWLSCCIPNEYYANLTTTTTTTASAANTMLLSNSIIEKPERTMYLHDVWIGDHDLYYNQQ